jgi:hypothetical protein
LAETEAEAEIEAVVVVVVVVIVIVEAEVDDVNTAVKELGVRASGFKASRLQCKSKIKFVESLYKVQRRSLQFKCLVLCSRKMSR